MTWVRLALGLGITLALVWAALVLALVLLRPKGALLREALRLLPDLLRLLRRLATDQTVSRRNRIRLGLMLAYLALPLDLIPDFVPVLGYADDAILVAALLRSVARSSGVATLRRNWPGTPDGFAALCRLVGLPVSAATSAVGGVLNFVRCQGSSLVRAARRRVPRR